MNIDGQCLCGAITYEAEVDPNQSYICNCRDCQTLAGSAFRWSVTVPQAKFSLLTGELKTYDKTSDSGERVPMTFCPNCGTAFYTIFTIAGVRYLNLRVPTARQQAELPPKSQYWIRSAQAWLATLDSIEGHATE